jgi:hypothetical protein
MKHVLGLLLLAIGVGCVERHVPTAPAGLLPSMSRSSESSVRVSALRSALRSRYPSSVHARLDAMLAETNGIATIVQLNDPDSQRLFDEIVDTRIEERARRSGVPSPRSQFRRLIVAGPTEQGKELTAKIIRRKAATISGQSVDAQYILVVPPNVTTESALVELLGAAKSYLVRIAGATSDTSVVVVPRPRASDAATESKSSTLRAMRDGPVQSIQGIGVVRTFPVVLDLSP